MDNINKQALERCRSKIVQNLIPDGDFEDLLIEKGIFTPGIIQQIQSEKIPNDKVRKILDNLPRRGPETFEIFIDILRMSRQSHIADTILKEKQQILRNHDELNQNQIPSGARMSSEDEEEDTDEEKEYVMVTNLEGMDKHKYGVMHAKQCEVSPRVTSIDVLYIPVTLATFEDSNYSCGLDPLTDSRELENFINISKERKFFRLRNSYRLKENAVRWECYVDSIETLQLLQKMLDKSFVLSYMRHYVKHHSKVVHSDVTVCIDEEAFTFCKEYFNDKNRELESIMESEDDRKAMQTEKTFYLYICDPDDVTKVQIMSSNKEINGKILRKCIKGDRNFPYPEEMTMEKCEELRFERLWSVTVSLSKSKDDTFTYYYKIQRTSHMLGKELTFESDKRTYWTSKTEFDIYEKKEINSGIVCFCLFILYSSRTDKSIQWTVWNVLRVMTSSKLKPKYARSLVKKLFGIFDKYSVNKDFCLTAMVILSVVSKKHYIDYITQNQAQQMLECCLCYKKGCILHEETKEKFTSALVNIFTKALSVRNQTFLSFMHFTYPILDEDIFSGLLKLEAFKQDHLYPNQLVDITTITVTLCTRLVENKLKPGWEKILEYILSLPWIEKVVACIGVIDVFYGNDENYKIRPAINIVIQTCGKRIKQFEIEKNISNLPDMLKSINREEHKKLKTVICDACLECISSENDESMSRNFNAIKRLVFDFDIFRDQELQEKIFICLASSPVELFQSLLLTILGEWKYVHLDVPKAHRIIQTLFSSILKSVRTEKALGYIYSMLSTILSLPVVKSNISLREELTRTTCLATKYKTIDEISNLLLSIGQIRDHVTKDIICDNICTWINEVKKKPRHEQEDVVNRICQGISEDLNDRNRMIILESVMNVCGLSNDASPEQAVELILNQHAFWKLLLQTIDSTKANLSDNPVFLKMYQTIEDLPDMMKQNLFHYKFLSLFSKEEFKQHWIDISNLVKPVNCFETELQAMKEITTKCEDTISSVIRYMEITMTQLKTESTLAKSMTIVIDFTVAKLRDFIEDRIFLQELLEINQTLPNHEDLFLATNLLKSTIFLRKNTDILQDVKIAQNVINKNNRLPENNQDSSVIMGKYFPTGKNRTNSYPDVMSQNIKGNFSDSVERLEYIPMKTFESFQKYDLHFSKVSEFVSQIMSRKRSYLNIWYPIVEGKEDVQIKDVEVLCCSNYTSEIDLAETVLSMKIKEGHVKAFKLLCKFDEYEKIVKSIYKVLSYFEIDSQYKSLFMKTSRDLLSATKGELRILQLMEGLEELYKIIDNIHPHMIEVIETLEESRSLIDFLREIKNEDIRNLIDAVEYSEQYVSELAVSSLIQVQQVFSPLFKEKEFSDVQNFVQEMQQVVNESGALFKGRIIQCNNNLHNLKLLCKNLSSREDMTRKVITSIVKKGTFEFQIKQGTCEFRVSYQDNSEKYTHSSSKLSDLKCQSILILNTKINNEIIETENCFQSFVDTVDIVFEVCHIYMELHRNGHPDYTPQEKPICMTELQLKNNLPNLRKEKAKWIDKLNSCRERYFYMNFIHGEHIQFLIGLLKSNSWCQVPSVLKFINPRITKQNFNKLKRIQHDELEQLAMSLQDIFEDVLHIPRCFNHSTYESKLLQENNFALIRLDTDSQNTFSVLLNMYLQTTGTVPEAEQVLFCGPETEWEDIGLLLGRCLYTQSQTSKRLYCLAYVELLPTSLQNKLVYELQNSLLQKSSILLRVIFRGNEHSSFFNYLSAYILNVTPLDDLKMKEHIRLLSQQVTVFTSAGPGLGKSEAVYEEASRQGKQIVTMHISGPLKQCRLVEQLSNLEIGDNSFLHIDIGVTDSHLILDVFLFELTFFRFVSVPAICFHLPFDIPVAIEIANTTDNHLFEKLLVPSYFEQIYLTWDISSRINISREQSSDIQIACQYLRLLEDNKLDNCDLLSTKLDNRLIMIKEQVTGILKNCDIIENRTSFTMLNAFLSVFADQLKRMTISKFFKCSILIDTFGQGNEIKTKVVKSLVTVSKMFSRRSIQYSSRATSPHETIMQKMVGKTQGMIRWTDNNPVIVVFNNQDRHTLSLLYKNTEQVPEEIRSLFEDLNVLIEDYKDMSQEQLQKLIVKIARPSYFPGLPDNPLLENYVLTTDNLLKMLLVLLRIQASVPVIIMGETGCGKTSLIKYLGCIRGIIMQVFNVHAGTTDLEIRDNIDSFNLEALNNLNQSYWLFIDEVNTSEHLGLLNDVLCHHRLYNKRLSPNAVFLAACNPYRYRNENSVFTAGLQEKQRYDDLSYLVYRVHPLPESLLQYVWDFGSLSQDDETSYIEKMVQTAYKKTSHWDIHISQVIVQLLSRSQTFSRETENEEYSVSLRDVKRCIHLIIWFEKEFFRLKEQSHLDMPLKAIILALGLCYYCRFQCTAIRRSYAFALEKVFLENGFKKYTHGRIIDIIRSEELEILENMTMPAGIAKNSCLAENVFVLIVAILNKIPLFLVGKPGCSKSLAVQLITNNMFGKRSKTDFFRRLPQIYPVFFQGSHSSTSEGIEYVFEKAMRYQAHNRDDDILSLVVLDEVGLAEHSSFNPLKVLHSLLEPDGERFCNVSVVGISNYALDPAKMNRALHLSRTDMDEEELVETSKSIIASASDCLSNFDILPSLAKAYIEFTKVQKTKHFIGLRDFYSLIKYIAKYLNKSPLTLTAIQKTILNGVLRNFGGSEPEKANEIFRKYLDMSDEITTGIDELIKENIKDKSSRHLMIITDGDSAMCKLVQILDEIGRSYVTIYGSYFEEDQSEAHHHQLLSQIILCMEKGEVLILKNLHNIYGSLYDMLNQNYSTFDEKKYCRVAFGSRVSPMCLVHNDFKCIVLLEEKDVRISDPPFLNRFEKQKFALRHEVNKSHATYLEELQKEFRILTNCEICNTGPIYSIEKQLYDMAPIYGEDMLPSLVLKVSDTVGMENPKFIEYCVRELIWISKPEALIKLDIVEINKQLQGYIKNLLKVYFSLPVHLGLEHFLLEMCPKLEAICQHYTTACETEEEFFHDAVSHLDLDIMQPFDSRCMADSRKTCHPVEFLIQESSTIYPSLCKKFVIFTHGNILSSLSLKHLSYERHRISDFKSKRGVLSTVTSFWLHSNNEVFVVQCDTNRDTENILPVRNILDNCYEKYQTRIKNGRKCICLIVHLHRNSPNILRDKFSFLSDWKMVFLDSLEPPDESIPQMYNRKLSDIITSRKGFITTCLRQNLTWSFTRLHFNTTFARTFDWMVSVTKIMQNNCTVIEELSKFLIQTIREEEVSADWLQKLSEDVNLSSSGLTMAIELRIQDRIRQSLSLMLYCLEEAAGLDIFTDDLKDDKFKAWKNCLTSPGVLSLEHIRKPTGPGCYRVNRQSQRMKVPFSLLLLHTIENYREVFLQEKSLRSEGIDIDNEREYKEMVEQITGMFRGYVEKELKTVPIEYDGISDDYIHDFSVYVSSMCICDLEESEELKAINWIIRQFTDIPSNFKELITKLHATLWLHRDEIFDNLKLFDIIKTLDHNIELVLERIYSSGNYRISLVQELFKSSFDLRENNITEWQEKMNGVFCLTESIPESQKNPEYLYIVPGWKFIHELVTLFVLPCQVDSSNIAPLIKYVSEGKFFTKEMFDGVWKMLNNILRPSEISQVDTFSLGTTQTVNKLQNIICMYVKRCFDTPLQEKPSPAVFLFFEKIRCKELFESNVSYLGSTLSFALEEFVSSDTFVCLLESDENCNDLREENHLLQLLHTIIVKEDEYSNLSVLLVNIIQNYAFKEYVNSDELLKSTSEKDYLIKLANEAHKAYRCKSNSLRKITAIAYLKQYLAVSVKDKCQALHNEVTCHNIKEILLRDDDTISSKELFYFFIRCLENGNGIADLRQRCKDIDHLGLVSNVKWSETFVKYCFDMRPLISLLPVKVLSSVEQIIDELELNENALKDLLRESFTSSDTLLSLLVPQLWIYLRRIYSLEQISSSRVTNLLLGCMEEVEMDPSIIMFISCLHKKNSFKFSIMDLPKSQFDFQTASFLNQLMCVAFGNSTNKGFWYLLVKCPNYVRDNALDLMQKNKSSFKTINIDTKLNLCKNKHRFLSRDVICPMCSAQSILPSNEVEIREEWKLKEHVSSVKWDSMSVITSKMMQLFVKGCLVNSYAIGNISAQNVLDLIEDTTKQVQYADDVLKDSLKQCWYDLCDLLLINDKELGRILQIVLCKAKDTLYNIHLSDALLRKDWENKIANIIEEIIISKEEKVCAHINEHNSLVSMPEDCVEYHLDENFDVSTTDSCKYKDLFGRNELPTWKNMYAKLLLEKKSIDYPFLNLFLEKMDLLRFPRVIPDLIRWHISVASIIKFHINKTDIKYITIEEFMSKQKDKTRQDLRRVYADFKNTWDFLRLNSEIIKKSYKTFPTLEILSNNTLLNTSIILDMNCKLYKIIEVLAKIHNCFIDHALEIAAEINSPSISFLNKGSNAAALSSIALMELDSTHIVCIENINDILSFSQCGTSFLKAKCISYDYRKIEHCLSLECLYKRLYIYMPKKHVPMIEFRDDFFKNSMLMLQEVEMLIPQSQLEDTTKTEIMKCINDDQIQQTEVFTATGVVLAMIVQTGQQTDMHFHDFFNKLRTTVSNIESYINILKFVETKICLRHVVDLYRLLEEVNGERIAAGLKESFRNNITEDEKYIIETKIKSDKHILSHLLQALKVFFNRELQFNEHDYDTYREIGTSLENSEFWCDRCRISNECLEVRKTTLDILSELHLKFGQMYTLFHLLNTPTQDKMVLTGVPKNKSRPKKKGWR